MESEVWLYLGRVDDDETWTLEANKHTAYVKHAGPGLWMWRIQLSDGTVVLRGRASEEEPAKHAAEYSLQIAENVH